MKEFIYKGKRTIFVTLSSFILLMILIILLHPYLYYIFESESSTIIHSFFEMFSIFVAFSIFLYGWNTYPYILTKTYLWLPVVFFSIGVFDLFHMITYPGMPPFITESSLNKTLWFSIMGGATESIGIFLLVLVMFNDKKERLRSRILIALLTVFTLLAITFLIINYEDYLPEIFSNGWTLFRNIIYLFICGIYVFSVIYIFKHLKKSQDEVYVYLVIAMFFLFLRTFISFFTNDFQGDWRYFAHLFKLLAYIYIFIGFYTSKLKLTFKKNEEIEEDLNIMQGLMESFFSNTPEGMLILNNQGKIIRLNQGFESIMGLSEADIIGKDLRTFINDSKEIDRILGEVLQGNNISNFPTIMKVGDKDNIYLLITLSKIHYKNTINIAVNIRDITEQKEYEQSLQVAKQELKETIRQQQGIIFKYRKVNGAFIHTLCDGELLYNIGFTPEQIMGYEFKKPMELGEPAKLYSYYQRAWEGREITFEFEWKQAIFAVSLKPIIRQSKIIEVVGSIVEITQLKKTEELLRKSEKLAVVGQLAASIAHEIRNPLTTLKGFNQLFGEDIDPIRPSIIGLMATELDRIEQITNEFMVIANPQTIDYKTHNLKGIIEKVLLLLESQATLNNIQISKIYTGSNLNLLCDENQLKQVFTNIIKNAIEAMPNGGKLTVEVKEIDYQYINISIKDTGVGIPKEILSKICEPFYTLKEKGTGLGLMVSYRIIEAHEGKIEFYSELSKGTIVNITLPLYKSTIEAVG